MSNLIYRLSSAERKNCVQSFMTEVIDLSGLGYITDYDDVTQLSFYEFCHYLNFTPTVNQQQLVHFTFSQRVTNAPAAHGVGKSFISAVLVLYATICKRSLVISTAPTRRQVESIIWRNVNDLFTVLKKNKAFRKRFGIDLKKEFAIGQTFLRQLDAATIAASDRLWYEDLCFDDDFDDSVLTDPNLGYAFGFTSRKDTSSFQGLHAPKLLMILDEATGIPDVIHEAALSCVTGSGNHILRIGNPTERGVAFFTSCVNDGCFAISAFDHPNVSPYYQKDAAGYYHLIDDSCLADDFVDDMPGAVSPKWIEEAVEKYGRDSLFVRTRIYAKFPLLGQGTTNLISSSLIALSQEPFEYTDSHLLQFSTNNFICGLDVGETGDNSVLTISQWIDGGRGNNAFGSGWLCVRGIYDRAYSGIDDGIEQHRVFEWARDIIEGFRSGTYLAESNVYLQIDSTGIGSGLSKDFLLNTRYVVAPIHFASGANDSRSYMNVRAEMYFHVARLYEKNRIRYFQSVEPDAVEEVHYQMSGTSYTIDPKNDKKRIIPKENIVSILGRSPDHADSLVLMVRGLTILEIAL
jgi:hypothetical protein